MDSRYEKIQLLRSKAKRLSLKNHGNLPHTQSTDSKAVKASSRYIYNSINLQFSSIDNEFISARCQLKEKANQYLFNWIEQGIVMIDPINLKSFQCSNTSESRCCLVHCGNRRN